MTTQHSRNGTRIKATLHKVMTLFDWTPARQAAVEALLLAQGWRLAHLSPLAADASFRRYFRLHDGGRRAVLMDAPPAREDIRPFVLLAKHLRGMGLSAPQPLAHDENNGLLLLQDLGDLTFTRLLEAGHEAPPLYASAVDVLVKLHRQTRAADVPIPAYDVDELIREALLFVDWYLPHSGAKALPQRIRLDFAAAWRAVFRSLPEPSTSLVLRDFHVDNLMQIETEGAKGDCGLLDFQDALVGPRAYDLVSLLQDARRDVPPALADAMYSRYLRLTQETDSPGFGRWYNALGAQRHAKVAGIFVRLCRRDGKCGYLAHLPRVLRLLKRNLAHPDLLPVTQWMAAHGGSPSLVPIRADGH